MILDAENKICLFNNKNANISFQNSKKGSFQDSRKGQCFTNKNEIKEDTKLQTKQKYNNMFFMNFHYMWVFKTKLSVFPSHT